MRVTDDGTFQALDERAMPEMRYVQRSEGGPLFLQQRWSVRVIERGHTVDLRWEWRDVPIVELWAASVEQVAEAVAA